MNNKLQIMFNKNKSIYQLNYIRIVSFQKDGTVYKTF